MKPRGKPANRQQIMFNPMTNSRPRTITDDVKNVTKLGGASRLLAAFTLIETLVVVLIVALLLAIVAPAMNSIMASTRLSAASQLVEGLLGEAQQIASAQGRPVEVRFYASNSDRHTASGQVGDPVGYDSVLILQHYAEGEADPDDMASPLAAPISLANAGGFNTLPNGIVISDNAAFSTLIANLPLESASGGSATKVKRNGTLVNLETDGYEQYRSFLFLPEGTNLGPGQWFLTIMNSADASGAALPRQFYTVQIDPVTSRITPYRP